MEESEQGTETVCNLNEGGKDMYRRFEILVLWECECVCVCLSVCVRARMGVSPE